MLPISQRYLKLNFCKEAHISCGSRLFKKYLIVLSRIFMKRGVLQKRRLISLL